MDICINFYLKLDINKNFGSIIVIINNLNEQWVNSQIWTLDAVETPSDLNLPKVTKISSKGEIEGFVFSRQNSTKDPIIRPLSLFLFESSTEKRRRHGAALELRHSRLLLFSPHCRWSSRLRSIYSWSSTNPPPVSLYSLSVLLPHPWRVCICVFCCCWSLDIFFAVLV